MNVIREYYVRYHQSLLPDIKNVFRIPLESSVPYVYEFLFFSLSAILDSLCFTVAVFVLALILFHIDPSSFSLLPSDFRPYVVASLVLLVALISHFLFYWLTLHRNIKQVRKLSSQN